MLNASLHATTNAQAFGLEHFILICVGLMLSLLALSIVATVQSVQRRRNVATRYRPRSRRA